MKALILLILATTISGFRFDAKTSTCDQVFERLHSQMLQENYEPFNMQQSPQGQAFAYLNVKTGGIKVVAFLVSGAEPGISAQNIGTCRGPENMIGHIWIASPPPAKPL